MANVNVPSKQLSLQEMLADPIVRIVMARDGVTEADVNALVVAVRGRRARKASKWTIANWLGFFGTNTRSSRIGNRQSAERSTSTNSQSWHGYFRALSWLSLSRKNNWNSK